jgi:putative flippase GtrA
MSEDRVSPERDLRRQFLRFVFVGCVNTGISYVVFLVLSQQVGYQLAYVAAYAAGIVSAYLLNTRFVFGTAPSIATALAYPLVYLVQYLLGAFVLHVAVEWLTIAPHWAAIAALVLTVPVSFLLNRVVLKARAAGQSRRAG